MVDHLVEGVGVDEATSAVTAHDGPAGATAFDEAVYEIRSGRDPQTAAAALFDLLTSDEKLGILGGDESVPQDRRAARRGAGPGQAGAVPRLGIPGLRIADCLRGVVCGSMALPDSMARSATWDVDLEERIGTAIGEELRARCDNLVDDVCLDPRHPTSDSAQEAYAGQPVLRCEMADALARGVERHALPCAGRDAPDAARRPHPAPPDRDAPEDKDRSVLRSLVARLRYHSRRRSTQPGDAAMPSPAHVELAREAAARSIVLVRNERVDGEPLLPLSPLNLDSVSVLGALPDVPDADEAHRGRRPRRVAAPLQGIVEALPDADVRYDVGVDAGRAAALAARTDVAIVVLSGPTAAERAGDRRPDREDHDAELVRAVSAANPRTIVITPAAGAASIDEQAPALLIGWPAGTEAGRALADVLFGRRDPSGRLPIAIAAAPADAPQPDALRRQPPIVGNGSRLLYPLGFGLSYTSFALLCAEYVIDEALHTTVTVANTGMADGNHVVQVYGTRLTGERADERVLLGFAAVDVPFGETRVVTVDAPLTPLGRWDEVERRTVIDPGPVAIEVGGFCGDPAALRVECVL